jgi:hypothetical protein
MGDLIITAVTLALAAGIASVAGWRPFGLRMAMVLIAFGLAYAVLSEWLNVAVRRRWAYTEAMPILPPFGTGLTPFGQWLAVPLVAWRFAVRPRLARQ